MFSVTLMPPVNLGDSRVLTGLARMPACKCGPAGLRTGSDSSGGLARDLGGAAFTRSGKPDKARDSA